MTFFCAGVTSIVFSAHNACQDTDEGAGWTGKVRRNIVGACWQTLEDMCSCNLFHRGTLTASWHSVTQMSPSSWNRDWWCWRTTFTGHLLFYRSLLSNFLFLSVSPLSSPDCDSHCKASKGKMKITMKKYCKKDYGESVQHAENICNHTSESSQEVRHLN